MALLGRLLARSLFGRRATPPPRAWPARGGSPRYRRTGRGRFGLFGPLPYYSTRTRRGSRVTVTGCCLPLALAPFAAAAVALVGVRHRGGR